MNINISKQHVIYAACAATSIVSIAYGVHALNKVSQIENLINSAVDNVSSSITIEDAIVKDAVNKAVDAKTDIVLSAAKSEALASASKTIASGVQSAIDSAKDNLEGQVVDQIAKKAAEISEDDIRESIIKKATAIAAKKFEGDLKHISQKYDDKLGAALRVYSIMAN